MPRLLCGVLAALMLAVPASGQALPATNEALFAPLALPTPNPNALKFSLPEGQVIPDGMRSYSTRGEAQTDPLARALFSVKGVENVFLVPAFATVTKHPAADWNLMIPGIEAALTEHAAG